MIRGCVDIPLPFRDGLGEGSGVNYPFFWFGTLARRALMLVVLRKFDLRWPRTGGLAPRQRQVLDSLSRSRTSCHQLVIRAKVMLMADEGWSNAAIGQRMALERHCIGKWRARWDAEARRLATSEQEATDKQLAALIEQVLADAPRPGAPAKFLAEQIVRIIALACENPVESVRPVTHWTPRHTSWLNQIEIWFSILVRRVIKRGNFTSIHDLRQKILDFIAYFNRTLAKPFKWTYTGRPLNV